MAQISRLKRKGHEEHTSHQNHGHQDGHGDGGHDEGNWLVSYADMMTLLCGFFVMMFAMASKEKPQAEAMKKAVAEHFKGNYESPSNPVSEQITKIVHEMGLDKEIKIQDSIEGVTLAFESTLFFDTLSSGLTGKGQEIIDKLISSVSDQKSTSILDYKVVIEGHTDSRPVVGGPFPTNWELSASRANQVLRLFLDHGFSSKNVVAIGYGSSRPEIPERNIDGSYNQENLARNRRVVIRLYNPETKSIPWNNSSPGANP